MLRHKYDDVGFLRRKTIGFHAHPRVGILGSPRRLLVCAGGVSSRGCGAGQGYASSLSDGLSGGVPPPLCPAFIEVNVESIA